MEFTHKYLIRQPVALINRLLKDNLLNKIIKNSGIILLGNSIASALGLISFITVANKLGPEKLALIVLSQTYALILNDIFNIQTWEALVKYGSNANEERVANVIKTNITLDFLSAFLAFILALLLARPVVHLLGWDESLVQFVSLYSISIFFNITTFTIGVPRLFRRFSAIAILQIAMAFLKVFCVFYAAYNSKTVLFYLCIYLSVEIFTNLLLIIFSIMLLGKELGRNWWMNSIVMDRNQIKFIWWTNLRTILRIPVRHFDMVVISSVMSVKMVGLYKVYKEIAGLIGRVGEPVNQAIFPEFAKLIGAAQIKQVVRVAKKSILLLAGLGAVITLVLLLTSEIIVAKFFGIEYLPQINALYIMVLLFGVSFLTVPVNSLFIAAGFAKYSFMIVLFTNSIYLVTAFSLGKVWGLYGVLVAFAVQMILNKGLKIFLLKKYSADWGGTVR